MQEEGLAGKQRLSWQVARAVLLGLCAGLLLSVLSIPKPRWATLPSVMSGKAAQPFVRRQLLPLVLRVLDAATPAAPRANFNRALQSAPALKRFLWGDRQADPVDQLECIVLWSVCFGTFLFALEREAVAYRVGPKPGSLRREWKWTALDVAALFGAMYLLHRFNYFYDPPTLAFAALALGSIRREKLGQLVLLTVVFSANRETALIVPGLVFFYWLYRNNLSQAVRQAALLSLCYLLTEGLIVSLFRHNEGQLAESYRSLMLHFYTHERLGTILVALTLGALYTLAVARAWRTLPPVLKAVQWFVPPLILLHLMYGYPMEWRVFLEIYPGVVLTILWLAKQLRLKREAMAPNRSSAAPA